MKSGKDRFIDGVKYIHGMGKSELAQHLTGVVASDNNQSIIGKDLSLGSRPDGEDDPKYATNTEKRRALRALLLCQRVYFSELWAVGSLIGGVHRCSYLPANWKTISLAHWSNKTEDQIQEGILTFAITTARVEALAEAADRQPNKSVPPPGLTLTRAEPNFPGLTSCYGSVITWMFRSGLASYRWYMKNFAAYNKDTLREAFGPAKIIWDGGTAFSKTDTLPRVPRGHIVHLYVDNPQRWNGHWLVSLGDGTACGCNNDTEEGAVPNDYSNRCSLDKQFLYGYKHPLDNGTIEKGVAEVIDPREIPGRM
jgi:hypothetical protein